MCLNESQRARPVHTRLACNAQVYIESILALQAKAGGNAQLPLAIMTSGDTHERTQNLLQDSNYFGMQPSQVTLLKQEKVQAPPAAHLSANTTTTSSCLDALCPIALSNALPCH